MKIDPLNLSPISDEELMSAFHERMAKVYEFMHVQETGTLQQRKDNVMPILRLTSALDLIKEEIKRRECENMSENNFDAFCSLNLN